MSELKTRKVLQGILKFIDDDEIIVIHGSRQVGKTSLLHYLQVNYVRKKSPSGNIFYFDLEDFRFLELCNSSPEDALSFARTKGADMDKRIYFFIDEIQYLNNPSSFLKLFHDRYRGKVKLIVSGSSSMLIKKKFKDSLAGRTVDFELFTLDFEEFLEFKGLNYKLGKQIPAIIQQELKALYTEFILFGGYPAIVIEESVEKKEIKIKQIINTYIKKDVRDVADIRDIDKFNDLVKLLASQIGGLLNVYEISNTLGIAKQTVQEYLFLLENTYIIKRVRPFHKNMRSELTKMPKIYFEDTGLANVLANKTFVHNLNGALLENSVFSQLRKNVPVEYLYYWRTNNKQEIDFIIDYVDKKGNACLNAIEVKNRFFNKQTVNLNYFRGLYENVATYFCCIEKIESPNDNRINVVSPWELLNSINSRK